MLKRIIIGLAAAGLLTLAPATPAHAVEGCVTYAEASRTLTDDTQSRASIQNGFDATPRSVVRHGNNLLRASYTPCRRPNVAFVEVIYTRNRVGQWKSFFWVYYLYSSPWARTFSDGWSAHS